MKPSKEEWLNDIKSHIYYKVGDRVKTYHMLPGIV